MTHTAQRNLRITLIATALALLATASLPADPVKHYLYWVSGGGFSSPPPLPTGWLGVADFDGDGDRDVLCEMRGHTLGGSPTRASVVIENLDGSALDLERHYTTHDITREPVNSFPDINSDGYHDLLFIGNDLQWGVFVADTMVSFEVFAGNTEDVIPIDWDFDSDIDLVALHSGDVIRWHENSGGLEPTFTDHTLLENAWWGMKFGDLNGDQMMDYVTNDSGGIQWHRNLGGEPPSFEQSTVLDTETWGEVEIRDINLDGAPDLLCRVGLNLVWLENVNGDASGWVQHVIEDGSGLADFSSINSIEYDVLIESSGFLSPVARHGNGNIYQYHVDTETPGRWNRTFVGNFNSSQWVGIDDLNGDGHADVLEIYSEISVNTVFDRCYKGSPWPCVFPDYPIYVNRFSYDGTASWWDTNPFSSDDLLLQLLGFEDPDPIYDFNQDGRVDSADLVWALSRGH